MTKLFVLPLMVATFATITGSTAVEARGWTSPYGRPGTIGRPKKRCTVKRPCSRMPELRLPPGQICNRCRGGHRR